MLNKKLKLSLIAIATIVAGNVNAQTYYSCIPQGCPAGQYFDGVKCLSLPTITSKHPGLFCNYSFKAIILKNNDSKVISSKGVAYTCNVESIHQSDACKTISCNIMLADEDSITYYTSCKERVYSSGNPKTIKCNNGRIQ